MSRRVLLGAVGLVIALIVAVGAWYELQAHPMGGPGRHVVVTVSSGESMSTVASAMAARGVISSALAYQIYFTVHGRPTVDAGHYLLRQNSTFGAVTGILRSTPNIGTISVNPGITLKEVAGFYGSLGLPHTTSAAFLAASQAVHSPWQPAGSSDLEGLLGTGTYLVYPGERPGTVVGQMVQRFDAQAAAAGVTPAAAAGLGITPYQLVTVASIVEKEGYIPANMGRVSRVIYNRLANGMPLQMDSTILYALGQDGGTVTPQDLQISSPYNTYLNTGLTPTPIGLVSPQALQAALHPPAGNWLFFVVVQRDGTEAFSSTYAGQLANEALARQRGLG